MKHRWLQYLALGCVTALGACGNNDEQTAPPDVPQMRVVTPPYANCDFGTVKNLINSYFTSPHQLTAQGYEGTMETGTEAERRASGFAIMDLIGQVSRGGTPPSPTIGSNLTKALTKCMFNTNQVAYTSLANGLGINGVEFDKALTPASGGVYFVVGAGYNNGTDEEGVLKGKVGGSRLSAVAPGPQVPTATDTLGTWASVLAGTANAYEGNRALVYGYPISTVLTNLIYEWATIDPLTTFSPYALVSLCDNSSDSSLMVHESNLGVLGYKSVNLCTGPDATGTATRYKSQFKNTSVSSIKVDWVTTPTSPLKLNKPTTFTVRATTQVSVNGQMVTQGVNNVCLSISGTNNNGVGTTLAGLQECDTDPNPPLGSTVVTSLTKTDNTLGAGYATFAFSVTKTGGLILTGAGREVVDRSDAIAFVNPVALKYTVNPK
jgi:hypothetical protein